MERHIQSNVNKVFYCYASTSSYAYFCNSLYFCFGSVIHGNHLRHFTNRACNFRSEITNKVNYTHNRATIWSSNSIVFIISLLYAQ